MEQIEWNEIEGQNRMGLDYRIEWNDMKWDRDEMR